MLHGVDILDVRFSIYGINLKVFSDIANEYLVGCSRLAILWIFIVLFLSLLHFFQTQLHCS